MNVSEILRQVADLMDQEEMDKQPDEEITIVPIEPDPDPEPESPCADAEEGTIEIGDVMVAPLQQEHELLKKVADVENNVDQFVDDNHDEDDGYNDELAAMLRIAGIGGTTVPNEETQHFEMSVNPRRNAALEYHKNRGQ